MLYKPQSKRYKNAKSFWIHLNDEAPHIGSGHRRVWAVVGRKWVYLANREDRQRIKLSTWNEITNYSIKENNQTKG
tara:strand:- start:53 stop:280 length:228 start_codon:yes stop_codon:yes gene_type:complete